MVVAYLVNQYPKISHTFIRREIAAVERAGVTVVRFSIRPAPEQLTSAEDVTEQARTRVVVTAGGWRLAAAVVLTALATPCRFAKALRTAWRMGLRSDRGLLRHMAYLAEACLLRRWLGECGAAHLHAHFGTNPAAVALLCRLLGGPPYSFTIHGSEEWDRPTLLSLKDKVHMAEFVVAVSSYVRSQIYRWASSSDWHKVVVVRCGLDEFFLRAPPTPPPASPRLVCVGRLRSEKGQLLLIEAAAELARRGTDFGMVLVGDGEQRSEIEAAIRHHGLAERVTISGWASSEEVRRQITGARALVLPSLMESLPVVIMEAFAVGRPVIATYVGGIPELVENGKCGWLVPAGSVEALAEAMRDALTAPVERLEEMGREGARRVAMWHDASAEGRKLAALFRESARAHEMKA